MSMSDSPIEVAVIGVGRMGRHHARVYRNMTDANLVAVVDADPHRAREVADEHGCLPYTTVQELLTRHPGLRAASVAVPTQAHVEVAQQLLERGIACLVEKPLAPSVAQAKVIADLAARSGAVLQVGHTERFNPAVRAVFALDITPRFMEVHRVSPMTFRSLDVGVVMDMMIHDLDIVLAFAGSKLARVDAVGVAVLAEHEDIANARLVFESGCVANLTASRLALKTERKLRIFSETTYVSLDYQKRSGVVIRKSENTTALEDVRKRLAQGGDLSSLDYSDLIHIEPLALDASAPQADPLTAELTDFLSAVRSGRSSGADCQAGYAAVEAAQRVVQAIHQHQWKGLGVAGGDAAGRNA